jgi:hypothetical protein
MMILPHPNGGERFVCEGMSSGCSLVNSNRAYLKQNWFRNNSGAVLSPLVVLTDGVKVIHQDLSALFGEDVGVILDWYHLENRVY